MDDFLCLGPWEVDVCFSLANKKKKNNKKKDFGNHTAEQMVENDCECTQDREPGRNAASSCEEEEFFTQQSSNTKQQMPEPFTRAAY